MQAEKSNIIQECDSDLTIQWEALNITVHSKSQNGLIRKIGKVVTLNGERV